MGEYPWLATLPPEMFGRPVGRLSRRPIFIKEPAMSALRRLALEERARDRRHEWDRRVRLRLGSYITEDTLLTSEVMFAVVRLPAQLVETPVDGDVLYRWRRGG